MLVKSSGDITAQEVQGRKFHVKTVVEVKFTLDHWVKVLFLAIRLTSQLSFFTVGKPASGK